MNKFEKQLEKWNNGILRGAQAKLAKVLKVSTATTALWATGKRRPSKGYVAQMARLFNLDVYQVIKLFEAPSAITYIPPAARLHTLHETVGANTYHVNSLSREEEYTLQANSVVLPFLDVCPKEYPVFPEENILECWSVPRRYAQGAKYIVRSSELGLKDAQNEMDLCFVRPGTEVSHDQTVILSNDKQIAVCRVLKHHNTRSYQCLSKTHIRVNQTWKILGVIVCRIKPF